MNIMRSEHTFHMEKAMMASHLQYEIQFPCVTVKAMSRLTHISQLSSEPDHIHRHRDDRHDSMCGNSAAPQPGVTWLHGAEGAAVSLSQYETFNVAANTIISASCYFDCVAGMFFYNLMKSFLS